VTRSIGYLLVIIDFVVEITCQNHYVVQSRTANLLLNEEQGTFLFPMGTPFFK